MTWELSSKSQSHRKREREKQDRADSKACEERAGGRCEVCGKYAPREMSGSMHHSIRKGSRTVRHDRKYHVWTCYECHTEAHGSNPAEVNQRCEDIVNERGE